MMRSAVASAVFVATVLCATTAQEAVQYDAIPETLVEMMREEPHDEGVEISRECFEKSCMHGDCHLAKMPCRHETMVPWSVFVSPQTSKQMLVQESNDGLVAVHMHKKPMDPNRATTMPGVPAEASPKLLKQMKKQDTLLKKIRVMEEWEFKNDPLHKKSRENWLELAEQIKHMPPSPEKLKNEMLLLKLAKQLAAKETLEHKKMKELVGKHDPADVDKTAVNPAMVKHLMNAVANQKNPTKAAKAAKALLPFLKKLAAHAGAQQDSDDAEDDSASQPNEINGIPVSHRKCYERACIKRSPDGKCAVAAIECGHGGKAPKETSKLSKKAALAHVKKQMDKLPFNPFAAAQKTVAVEVDPDSIVVEDYVV
jgi:hypothetical protein